MHCYCDILLRPLIAQHEQEGPRNRLRHVHRDEQDSNVDTVESNVGSDADGEEYEW